MELPYAPVHDFTSIKLLADLLSISIWWVWFCHLGISRFVNFFMWVAGCRYHHIFFCCKIHVSVHYYFRWNVACIYLSILSIFLPFSVERLLCLFHSFSLGACTFIKLRYGILFLSLKIHILSTALKPSVFLFHASIYYKCHPKLCGAFFFTTVKEYVWFHVSYVLPLPPVNMSS